MSIVKYVRALAVLLCCLVENETGGCCLKLRRSSILLHVLSSSCPHTTLSSSACSSRARNVITLSMHISINRFFVVIRTILQIAPSDRPRVRSQEPSSSTLLLTSLLFHARSTHYVCFRNAHSRDHRLGQRTQRTNGMHQC